MPPRNIHDANHWRDRAAQMRVLAEGVTDLEKRQVINRLADDYDKLAERAASRARGVSSNLRRDFGSLVPK
jgi:hypothetical protein